MSMFQTVSQRIACVGVSVAMLSVGAADIEASIVLPVTGGQASGPGGGFNTFGNAFDAQPTSVPTAGATIEGYGSNYQIDYGGDRAGFVDFGVGYADITLTEVYVLLRKNGNSVAGSATYWWSNDTDAPFEAGEGDIAAPDFDVFDPQGTVVSASNVWVQAWTGAEAPAQRYLIVSFDGALEDHSNGLGEIAFVGNVPEPASLALASLGALLVLGRRCRDQS